MPVVFAVHTTPASVDIVKPLLAEILPHVRVVNVIDDGLLAEVREAGRLTRSVTRRFVGYGILAQSAGADAILSCCSSMGEAVDVLNQVIETPVVRIDGAMAERGVLSGRRISIIATLPTTLGPTERLLQQTAARLGRTIETRRCLAEGAFDALMSGDPSRHDAMVAEAIRAASADTDVIVLAQGSMARLVPLVAADVAVPVLSSPRLGIEALQRVLDLGD